MTEKNSSPKYERAENRKKKYNYNFMVVSIHTSEPGMVYIILALGKLRQESCLEF